MPRYSAMCTFSCHIVARCLSYKILLSLSVCLKKPLKFSKFAILYRFYKPFCIFPRDIIWDVDTRENYCLYNAGCWLVTLFTFWWLDVLRVCLLLQWSALQGQGRFPKNSIFLKFSYESYLFGLYCFCCKVKPDVFLSTSR